MKLWIDDLRPAPFGMQLATSVNEAIERITSAEKMAAFARSRIDLAKDRLHLGYITDAEAADIIDRWNQTIRVCTIELISLDHDMGDNAKDGGDGIKLMDWLVERGTLYPVEFHTMNSVGRMNMERMYRRYWLKERI